MALFSSYVIEENTGYRRYAVLARISRPLSTATRDMPFRSGVLVTRTLDIVSNYASDPPSCARTEGHLMRLATKSGEKYGIGSKLTSFAAVSAWRGPFFFLWSARTCLW